MLLSCPSPSFLLFTCFRSAQRQLLTDQHHCAYLQVYFCLFLCQITDLCFAVLAYTKFTLPHLGSGAEKPSGSEGFNLSFVNLFDHLSWCEIMTREITLLIINAERLGSDTAAVVVYLGLLAPDTSTGARKPPLGGFHCHVSADEAAWHSHKVPDKEDASTNTHLACSWSGCKGMGTLEK